MNAIILAAGTSSRFVPLSSERPKGLLDVKGEILIERQIRQLLESGIQDITLVLGYMAELFEYLAPKYDVRLVYNEDYSRYNNTSSIVRVLDKLDDTFICCSDHYFERNVFLDRDTESYYAVQYAEGETAEWCVRTDPNDRITKITVGGADAWYLAAHAYFSPSFSRSFRRILRREYRKEIIRNGYWEDVLINHLEELPIKARRYGKEVFREFDSIDELRAFDASYLNDTRSSVLKSICSELKCEERDLSGFERIKHEGEFLLFSFKKDGMNYVYNGEGPSIKTDIHE